MDWRFYYGIEDRGFAARRHKGPARRGCYPKWRQPAVARETRGTNLKFQIGDFREEKAPDFWCLRKHMISRRLGPFSMFFTPFLSQKGLISRRLRRKGTKDFFSQRTQSRRSLDPNPILRKCCSWIGSVPSHARREAVDWRIKRSEVGLGGSLSGIKWDYAGRKSAASRLIPDIPAYSRIMRLEIFNHGWTPINTDGEVRHVLREFSRSRRGLHPIEYGGKNRRIRHDITQ